jgi:hypothetical protein
MDVLFLILCGGALLIAFLFLIKPLIFPQALAVAILLLSIWEFVEHFTGGGHVFPGTIK